MPDLSHIATGRAADRVDAARVIAEWQELRLRTALGATFHSKASRIVIRKPAWMPESLYRALMRTIVIEERDEPAPPAPRRERREARRRVR